ncbi:MAG: hypothetical protein J1F23_05785 [Oscillospiraceae bacterium]|nr:hypothetical protein [Oscillospiraceae bacterium]
MQEYSPEVKACLKTLPISVQTAITESNAQIDTVEQLQTLAAAYLGNV